MVVESRGDQVGGLDARNGELKVFNGSEGPGADDNILVLSSYGAGCNYIRAKRVSNAAITSTEALSCYYLVLVPFLEQIGCKPPGAIASHSCLHSCLSTGCQTSTSYQHEEGKQ